MKIESGKCMIGFAVAALLLGGCGNQGTEEQAAEVDQTEEEGQTIDESPEVIEEQTADPQEPADADLAEDVESPEDREKKEKYGENCIPEHSFETELNGLEGTVSFVSYAPDGDHSEIYIQLIQNGEVMETIVPLVSGKWFASLEAVSLWDVNFDGFTDMVIIGSNPYVDNPFVAVYYGEIPDYEESKNYHFTCMEELSENLSDRAEEPLTIKEIRRQLAGGKKNGEFANYAEAYEAVVNLSVLEGLSEFETEYGSKFLYDLIYVDEDEVPELVTGLEGYYVNLYTYRDGTVYTLMDQWGYGAMGNTGYEYAPGKNSLRNYNADQAGAILRTYYMKINEHPEIETQVWTESYNFVDSNGNGMLDEGEEYGEGERKVSVNGEEASEEEAAAVYDAYDMGDYQYIEGRMDVEAVRDALRQ